MDLTPQRFGFLQMNQYDLEDLQSTRLQPTVKCGVRIDFTLRGPGLRSKVSFLRGK